MSTRKTVNSLSKGKEDEETETEYVHRGVSKRSFTRYLTLSDETEVRSVTFEDESNEHHLGKWCQRHISEKIGSKYN